MSSMRETQAQSKPSAQSGKEEAAPAGKGAAALPLRQMPAPWLLWLLLAGWNLSMISIPIVLWIAGNGVLPTGVTISVLLQAATSLTALALVWGPRATLRTALVVLPLAWLVEFVGSTTGFPFGSYDYTQALQPQIGGVPLLVPLAWLMMLPPAWAVAERISGGRRGLRYALTAAFAFTAWDLFLDPQMVHWGYWQWQQPGGYFGIPWVNFAGWLLAALLLTAIVRPAPLRSTPLFAIYVITWLLQSIGLAFFWGMPGPALAGFVAMGVFVLAATNRVLDADQRAKARGDADLGTI